MASASRPLLDSMPKHGGSLGTIEQRLLYDFKTNTQRLEKYEIIAPNQEGDFLQDGSYAMSILIENILNHFLALRAEIVSPSKVLEYLYQYPEIAELSKYVSDLVYRHFDFKTQLSLEIINDEDNDGDYLALYLRVPKYDESVMDRIKIIQERYYPLLSQMSGWFLFTTDFGPLR